MPNLYRTNGLILDFWTSAGKVRQSSDELPGGIYVPLSIDSVRHFVSRLLDLARRRANI